MDVTWEEPSGRRDNSGTANMVADTLKAHKGQWAIIAEDDLPSEEAANKKLRAQASNRASLIKQGRLRPYRPKGTFEAVSRSVIIDEEGNSVIEINDSLVIDQVAANSQRSQGDEPAGAVRRLVRVFARYLGEEFAQPTADPKPRKKAKDKAEDTASEDTAPDDAPVVVDQDGDAPASKELADA